MVKVFLESKPSPKLNVFQFSTFPVNSIKICNFLSYFSNRKANVGRQEQLGGGKDPTEKAVLMRTHCFPVGPGPAQGLFLLKKWLKVLNSHSSHSELCCHATIV